MLAALISSWIPTPPAISMHLGCSRCVSRLAFFDLLYVCVLWQGRGLGLELGSSRSVVSSLVAEEFL